MDMKTEKKNPVVKVRVGRFSLSLWRRRKLLASGNKDAICYVETPVSLDRVCLQHSVKNWQTGRWVNQQIWMSPEDVRNLLCLLDRFNEEIWNGEENSSSAGGE